MSLRYKMSEDGHVLLGALLVILILALLSVTLLYLAGQDAPGISAMREQTQGQHLAEGAADLLVSWFHEPATAPASLSGVLTKRQDVGDGPAFFDAAGRSQFSGTPERPDVLLDASTERDARILNGSPTGFGGGLMELGRFERLKIYGPIQPGLLSTVEVTASTKNRKLASTIQVQLGALNIPAIRAAVQAGQRLGAAGTGTSTVLAHWGDVRVLGDMVINRSNDLIVKNVNASVTGQPYQALGTFEDRWIDYWFGGNLVVLSPSDNGSIPPNVYAHQQPTPGLRLDRWDYDLLKKTAQRFGTYYRLNRDGRLHTLGAPESDPGMLPSEVVTSSTVGRAHGLIFIDTLDGEAPAADNMGTLVLDLDYVEALLVVQANVILRPSGVGRTFSVLSPPPEGSSATSSRVPVTLSDIHLNGLLYAAGSITVERETRIYGALFGAGAIAAASPLEIWYNSDFGKGFFRGLPVVYMAPSTWQVKY